MAVVTKVEPIARDIDILVSGLLSPEAQRKAVADFAREKLAEGQETNRRVLGRVPPHKTYVDGAEGQRLEYVRPNGVIVFEFELIVDTLVWIAEWLVAHSPVGSGSDPHPGLYKRSHTLFANGKEVDAAGEIPVADEYVFINTLPYARKIEQGQSKQFPEGVYEATAAMARRRYGNQARINFTYRGLIGTSSGSGTLVNPLRDPTRAAARTRSASGRFTDMGGPKAYNVASVRFPCIVVSLRT
jgi:hypothetical protein